MWNGENTLLYNKGKKIPPCSNPRMNSFQIPLTTWLINKGVPCGLVRFSLKICIFIQTNVTHVHPDMLQVCTQLIVTHLGLAVSSGFVLLYNMCRLVRVGLFFTPEKKCRKERSKNLVCTPRHFWGSIWQLITTNWNKIIWSGVILFHFCIGIH